MNISSIYNPEQRRIAESLNRVKVTFSSNPEDQKFIWNGVGYGLTKVIFIDQLIRALKRL